jgi:hypothetical protein
VVGEPEQVVGPQSGLDVLEGDVVDRLAVAERVVEVLSPVAKPGIVNAWMSLRGRPSRSIAFAATISACVESRPPLTPITIFG